jgi:hypothetical protein
MWMTEGQNGMLLTTSPDTYTSRKLNPSHPTLSPKPPLGDLLLCPCICRIP